jgi:hypothetical protein
MRHTSILDGDADGREGHREQTARMTLRWQMCSRTIQDGRLSTSRLGGTRMVGRPAASVCG